MSHLTNGSPQKKLKGKSEFSSEFQQLPDPSKLQDFENKQLFNNPSLYLEYRSYYSQLDEYSDMYSESHLSFADHAYICTLNNLQWKKLNKKEDILSAQKLILKHMTLIHLLIPLHKSMSTRFHEIQNHYEQFLGTYLRDCELRFVESQKQKHFGTLCDSSNRYFCSPIDQDSHHRQIITVFQKYHRYLGNAEENDITNLHQDLYTDDLKFAYEYVIGLKASIAAMHDGILSMQSIGLGAKLKKKQLKNKNLGLFGPSSLAAPMTPIGSSSATSGKKNKTADDDMDLDRKSMTTAVATGQDGSQLPAFDYVFSPDIICLLWHQEYEKIHQQELSYNLVKEKDRHNNVLLSSAQDVKSIVQSAVPLKRIERGPYNLSRHTHFGAGLELLHRHLVDAEKAKSSFSFFSLTVTPDELRGVLSLPAPFHVIDRYKLGSILNKDLLEKVNVDFLHQTYQQMYVLYTPRISVPTRVDLSYLPSPVQKLPDLKLTMLNYGLSGSLSDIFLRYVEVLGDDLDMYSECRLSKLKDVFYCGIGKQTGWFHRPDKKGDLYQIQKLILKHSVIIQLLATSFTEMVKRYRTLFSEHADKRYVAEWVEHEKKMIATTQIHSTIYGPFADGSTTLTLMGTPFQDMFNCYHRYSYSNSFVPTFASKSAKKLSIDELYDQALNKDLPLSYEIIFRLKILLYTIYDRILIIQSLTHPQWLADKNNRALPVDVLSVLWYQAHYRSISSQESQDSVDVQRKMLHRKESPFPAIAQRAQEASKKDPKFVTCIQSLTLSDEEQRSLFRPPPTDAVLDIAAVLETSKACDGKTVPDWINLSYCNRFVQYCYRPQLPHFRLPVLPENVLDDSTHEYSPAASTSAHSGNPITGFFSRRTSLAPSSTPVNLNKANTIAARSTQQKPTGSSTNTPPAQSTTLSIQPLDASSMEDSRNSFSNASPHNSNIFSQLFRRTKSAEYTENGQGSPSMGPRQSNVNDHDSSQHNLNFGQKTPQSSSQDPYATPKQSQAQREQPSPLLMVGQKAPASSPQQKPELTININDKDTNNTSQTTPSNLDQLSPLATPSSNDESELGATTPMHSNISNNNDVPRESMIMRGIRAFRRGSTQSTNTTTSVTTTINSAAHPSPAPKSTTLNAPPAVPGSPTNSFDDQYFERPTTKSSSKGSQNGTPSSQSTTLQVKPAPLHVDLGDGLRSLDLDHDFFRDSVLLDFEFPSKTKSTKK